MNHINTKRVLAAYNAAHAKQLTQEEFGRLLFGNEVRNPKQAGWYLSMWQSGKETCKLTPRLIRRMADLTGLSINDIFEI